MTRDAASRLSIIQIREYEGDPVTQPMTLSAASGGYGNVGGQSASTMTAGMGGGALSDAHGCGGGGLVQFSRPGPPTLASHNQGPSGHGGQGLEPRVR